MVFNMPVINSVNAQILPQNTRAVDVVQEALRDVAAIQQLKYDNAFKVAGYEALVYHKLDSGKPCSCGARGKALATRLGEDGKLDQGGINKLVTGGYEFKVRIYGSKNGNDPKFAEDNGIPQQPHRELSLRETVDDISQFTPTLQGVARDSLEPNAYDIDADGDRFGSNGPVASEDVLDNLVSKSFDDFEFGLTDVSCPICMGTGFKGGFTVEGGWRQLLTPDEPEAQYDGTIDTLVRPLAVEDCKVFQYQLIIPKGCLRVDVLNVWNKNRIVPVTFMVDSTPLLYPNQLIKYADGLPHTFVALFRNKVRFTHIEIQVSLSDKIVQIDFPKLTQGSDIKKLDSTEDVTLMASPTLSMIRRLDIVVESVFGKAFQVESVPLWNDNNRRVLGWEFQARVIQPQELFALLPRRRQLKQQPTLTVRPNANQGNNRT